MKVHLSELRNRPVMDLSSATTVGRIERVVLDLGRSAVSGFVLGKVEGPETILPWDGVKSIGPDAVTIDDTSLMREPSGSAETRSAAGDLEPIGKLVLTQFGDEAGELRDLVVETETGEATDLVIGEQTVPGRRLLGVGDYAAIVSTTDR